MPKVVGFTGLVPGHTLVGEGRPRWTESRTSAPARCSCGIQSEPLTSTMKRKAWHREHKAAIYESGDRP